MPQIAIVTGANRGIGFEVARQLAEKGVHVVLTSRDKEKGQTAIEQLQQISYPVEFHQLDVTDPSSIETLKNFLQQKFNKIDILINNAGIFPSGINNLSIFDIKINTIRETMETNIYGPLQLIQAIVPIMAHNCRIINVSSSMGQLNQMDSGYPAYRISKTALNVITKLVAEELKENTNISINSVCPGWVKTDMGGPRAPKSVTEGADTIVWLALMDNPPTGGFFRDRQKIEW